MSDSDNIEPRPAWPKAGDPAAALRVVSVPALEALHAHFAQGFATSLAAALRSPVKLRLAGIDRTAYCRFILDLQRPACLAVLKVEPREGRWLVDFSPAVVCRMMDRLLGGGRDAATPSPGPLTEIDQRLFARVVNLLSAELCRAWEPVRELKLELARLASDASSLRALPPQETMVRAVFDLTVDAVRGALSIGIPARWIEQIGQWFAADAGSSSGQSGQAGRRLGPVAEISVHLAETRLEAAELDALVPGDIIATEKDADSPLIVVVDGQPQFLGFAGSIGGRKAIRIQRAIDDQQPG